MYMTIPFLHLPESPDGTSGNILFKWAVTIVISDGNINLPQGSVWVCRGKHTHFIIPEGSKVKYYHTKHKEKVKI